MEIAEKSAKKFESSALKNKWGANKGRDTVQSSQAKGKVTLAVKVSEAPSKPKKSNSNSTPEFKSPQRQYFKDEHMLTIFHLLNKNNKLKLPEARCSEEVRRANDPN